MKLRLNAGIGHHHPECRADERFVTYVNKNGFDQIGWTTKRVGTQVFTDDGDDVTVKAKGKIFPVFAQSSELDRANNRT